MRKSVFYVLFFTCFILACDGVLWPWWDHREANFVEALLYYMKPAGGDNGGAMVYLGPPVATSATALVTGKLKVISPPKSDPNRDFYGGKTYPNCTYVYQQMEVKPQWWEKIIHGDDWKPHGNAHELAGAGFSIGSWAIDPRFFKSALAPRENLSNESSGAMNGLQCPEGYDECHVVESCVTLGDYSILGNRTAAPGPAGNFMVSLPNDDLIDYPLFQSGRETPKEFSVNYKIRMAERVKVYPLYEGIAVCIMCLIMLILSREEIDIGTIEGEPHAALIKLAVAILKTTHTPLDHLTTWLVLGTPFLPVIAYQNIPNDGLFTLLIYSYVISFFVMLACLQRRLKMGPQSTERKGDPTLPL